MASPLVDDAPKDIKNLLTVMETDPWLELGLQRLEPHAGSTPLRFEGEESGKLVGPIEIETQSERNALVDNYYVDPVTPTNEIFLIHDNDAAVYGTTVIGGTVAIGGTTVIGGTVAIGSNAILSDGLTIREQMPVTCFHIWPATWDKCRQFLSAFASHAEEVLEHKKIEITGTRIRDWRAIDDTNWKQCILDLTVNTESHIALRIWDELSEELQKSVDMQPEVFRPFLEDKVSLNVKWV